MYLRIMDRRIDKAIRSLLAQTLNEGGRIVNEGSPRVLCPIIRQIQQWNVSQETERPVRIYQSEFYKTADVSPGREELIRCGAGDVRWVSTDLGKIANDWNIPPTLVQHWLSITMPQPQPQSDELRRALLAMRIQMLFECQPKSAFSIGGVHGVEPDAHIYLDLVKAGLIRGQPRVNVIGSTFGNSVNLQGEGIYNADHPPISVYRHPVGGPVRSQSLRMLNADSIPNLGEATDESRSQEYPESPQNLSPQTAKTEIRRRIPYDLTFQSLIENIPL